MSRRGWLLLLGGVPLLALFALLGWGIARSGGLPGGLGVNSKLGEVAVEGQMAPPFTVTTLDGQEIGPSSFQGQVVMLDFWSSWCGPCRAEAPVVSQVYLEYADKPVEFLGIAIWDKASAVSRFNDEFNVQYPNAIDPKGRIALDYGVKGIPEKYFLDAEGMIVKKYTGPMDPGSLRNILDDLLADLPPEQARSP